MQNTARTMYSDHMCRPGKSPKISAAVVESGTTNPASLLQEFDSVSMKRGGEGHSVTTRRFAKYLTRMENLSVHVPSERLSAWTEKRELGRAKSVVHNICVHPERR
ncbi:uncharacterized protein LOC144106838 [Amblyomma americanum]